MRGSELRPRRSRVPGFWILFFATGLLFAGCSGDEVKPNRDSVLATNTLKTVEKIFERYQAQEFALMQNYISPAFGTFRSDTGFEKVRHDYDVLWVRIENDAIQIVLGWEGSWKLEGGRDVSGGGQCTLIFSAGTGRMTGLEGDNPFALPEKTGPAAPGFR